MIKARLDEGEVGQVPVGGVGLELGERHEVRGQVILQPLVVDDGGGRELHRLGDVDLPGLAVVLQPVEDRLGIVAGQPLLGRTVHGQS